MAVVPHLAAAVSAPTIRISHVTKRYRIFPTPWQRLRDALGWRSEYKEFDALHDVSFEINSGEFWGIVGKNGSGKSTLLKIIAGQLHPTSGHIDCAGRITLLQLGLGFDPELSGIENVKQSRMLQNLADDFEEVADFVERFSELGDFIRYPVKTYSSGMYSRLAFATAIAGDPDILIADEVLAVGDMNFAQKCLAKMREFKERGKTVVLVTHDVNTVKSFCDRAVWLNDGKVMRLGSAKNVAEDYRNFMLYGVISNVNAGEESGGTAPHRQPDGVSGQDSGWVTPNAARRTVSEGKIAILSYRFLHAKTGEVLTKWRPGNTVEVQFRFATLQPCELHSFGFTLHDRHGMISVHLNSDFFGGSRFQPPVGEPWLACFRFDAPMLASGDYSISFGCSEGGTGVLIEKYDHDSVVTIEHARSPVTDRQGGYVVVGSGCFEYCRSD